MIKPSTADAGMDEGHVPARSTRTRTAFVCARNPFSFDTRTRSSQARPHSGPALGRAAINHHPFRPWRLYARIGLAALALGLGFDLGDLRLAVAEGDLGQHEHASTSSSVVGYARAPASSESSPRLASGTCTWTVPVQAPVLHAP